MDISKSRDSWRIITDREFQNAKYVFPLQQRDVLKIVEKAEKEPNIHRVIIFGSSVTAQCNPWSDIDVYLEQVSENTTITFEDLEAPVDKWTNFSTDEDLLKEIKTTGVCVYEK